MNTENSSNSNVEPNSEPVAVHKLISKVLSPAVRLWLRSQVEQVAHLEVQISGSNRQILRGYIPRISISARDAVYQGLHISQIQLLGENIRINLGQVLQGKQLRLLEPVTVSGDLGLKQSDLHASLKSNLLANALTDLLKMLLPASDLVDGQISWNSITLDSDQLTISGILAADTTYPTPIVIRSSLQLASCHELELQQPQIQMQVGLPPINLDTYKLDLGAEVDIKQLTLSPGQLMCSGRINVIPAE